MDVFKMLEPECKTISKMLNHLNQMCSTFRKASLEYNTIPLIVSIFVSEVKTIAYWSCVGELGLYLRLYLSVNLSRSEVRLLSNIPFVCAANFMLNDC